MKETKLLKEIGAPLPDFEPKFFIIDKCRIRVLAVREQDKYEFKGVWIEKNADWEMYAASLNIQALAEWPSRFELSKEEHWMAYPDFMQNYPKKTEEECQLMYAHENTFIY